MKVLLLNTSERTGGAAVEANRQYTLWRQYINLYQQLLWYIL